MDNRNLRAALVLTALILSGCGSEIGGGGIAVDTINGVLSVRNPERGVLGDSVPWGLTEYLRVGGEAQYDGLVATYALDVGIMNDGGVVVLDAGNQRVLRFGSDRAYMGSFGGQGDGPGQFRVPLLLEVADSLIYVVDPGFNRLNAFDASGDFLFSFDLELGGLAGTSPAFAAGGPDEIYLFGEPAPVAAATRDTGRAVIMRMDRAGAITDTVLTFPPPQWTPIQLPSGRTTFAKPRLMPEPKFSAKSGAIASSATSGYVLDVRTPRGSPMLRISREYRNTRVTMEIRDSVLNRLAQGPTRMPREYLELVPFAPVIPAIEDVVLDDRGRLWVDVYEPSQPNRIDIFDEEGRFLGPLRLPSAMRLEDVRNGIACGVMSQATGQAEVICYRFSSRKAE